MEATEGFKKLAEHYKGCIEPGLIIGDTLAIVGQFGIEIVTFTSPNTSKVVKYFKEGDQLPIIEFNENLLTIDIGWSFPLRLPYNKFKAFIFKNKLFTSHNSK